MEFSKIFFSRKMILLMAAVLLVRLSGAQGLKQWFSQKKTQTEYLIQQIAALKVYTGYLEKGYETLQGGLRTIGDLKQGHFNLDQAFFDRFKMISPKVKSYSRVADIISLNLQAVRLSAGAMKGARDSDRFNEDELRYADKVFEKLLGECGALTDELASLLTAGALQLSDDERIKRIDRVYKDMQERCRFVKSFCSDLQTLQLQRSKELRDIKGIQKMYGQ